MLLRTLLYFFFTSLLEYNGFTMLCQFPLYNKVNQLYAYIYPYIPSLLHLPPNLPIPPLQVVTKHRADLPVLCGCFPLAIYFTCGSVHTSMLLSPFVPAYPSPLTLCPQVHSLLLHLYSCPAPRFVRTILRILLFRWKVLDRWGSNVLFLASLPLACSSLSVDELDSSFCLSAQLTQSTGQTHSQYFPFLMWE